MKLNAFDGGLSTRVDPSLILPNEAVEYSNIDNTAIVLKSAKGPTSLDEIVGGYFYEFKDQWLSSDAERSYVEYQDKLYYTESGKPAMKTDGFLESTIGIPGPLYKLTATQADPDASEKISADASTLQYTYTYYSSQYGIESAPAPISDELDLEADKVVDLTGFAPSDNPQVDQIKIYRIGDGTTTMTLVDTIANTDITDETTEIRDDTLTLDLPGTLLDSYNNLPPPSGSQYIIEAYGILFVAVEDKLYFSVIGKPDYFPASNYIDFAKDITGLLLVPNGILVFQRNRTDILIGTSSADFRVLPVSKEQGCISHLSARIVKNIPVWVSLEGICSYTSGYVQVISKDKIGKTSLSVVNTCVFDETYYICLTDGSLFVMDARFGMAFKKYSFTDNIDNILESDGVLYARIDDTLYELFTGDTLDFTYKSPVLTEGEHTVTKLYNNIYIRINGEIDIKVYIDGVNVLQKTLKGNKVFDITPNQEKQRGTNIQFEINGSGTVYELEYKAVGRQNGR